MIRSRPRRAMSQINVVPYIDVMLVLLIIFMVTAPFINPSQVTLPRVGKSSQAPASPIVVEIRKDGTLGLREQGTTSKAIPVSREDLAQEIRRMRGKDQAVVISADERVRYKEVMDVMSDLQPMVPHLGLLVKQKP